MYDYKDGVCIHAKWMHANVIITKPGHVHMYEYSCMARRSNYRQQYNYHRSKQTDYVIYYRKHINVIYSYRTSADSGIHRTHCACSKKIVDQCTEPIASGVVTIYLDVCRSCGPYLVRTVRTVRKMLYGYSKRYRQRCYYCSCSGKIG